MLFDAHTRSFAALGGVPRRGIYDNMRTAVDKVKKGKEQVVNARFSNLCAHYSVPCEFAGQVVSTRPYPTTVKIVAQTRWRPSTGGSATRGPRQRRRKLLKPGCLCSFCGTKYKQKTLKVACKSLMLWLHDLDSNQGPADEQFAGRTSIHAGFGRFSFQSHPHFSGKSPL